MPILELKNQISHRRVELFAAAHSAHLVFTQLPGVCALQTSGATEPGALVLGDLHDDICKM